MTQPEDSSSKTHFPPLRLTAAKVEPPTLSGMQTARRSPELSNQNSGPEGSTNSDARANCRMCAASAGGLLSATHPSSGDIAHPVTDGASGAATQPAKKRPHNDAMALLRITAAAEARAGFRASHSSSLLCPLALRQPERVFARTASMPKRQRRLPAIRMVPRQTKPMNAPTERRTRAETSAGVVSKTAGATKCPSRTPGTKNKITQNQNETAMTAFSHFRARRSRSALLIGCVIAALRHNAVGKPRAKALRLCESGAQCART